MPSLMLGGVLAREITCISVMDVLNMELEAWRMTGGVYCEQNDRSNTPWCLRAIM